MATKNLELYFQHAPVASLNALKAIDTSGIVTGLIVEVVGVGFFNFQTPPVATPDNLNVIQATDLGGVWIRQTLPQLNATAGGKIDASSLGTVANSAVLVTSAGGVSDWETTLPAVAAGACTCTDPTTSGTESIDTALSNVLAAEPPLATAATNIEGGDANYLPYQTATDTTDFITAAASSVLVTDGSNLPSWATTLPAVEAGACTCTDPTTSSSASIDTALSNVYSAVIPPESYVVNVSSVSLDPTSIVPQIITGAQLSLPIGKYLISYSSSQTCTPTATNTGATCTSIPYLYNSTTGFDIDDTASSALVGKAITGAEIFGGTGSLTTIQTFVIPTTIDVYVQINNLIGAGATLVADETTITAVRLANTQATYSAAAPLVADSTSTSPQIVTGAQLVLPAGKYLLTYSTSQSLITKVADATTAFEAKSYIYNTTGAAIVANTEYITFSGYAETGAEIFGGTSSATVVVTLGVTTTLDVYAQLSAATDAADTYAVAAEISAVKLD